LSRIAHDKNYNIIEISEELEGDVIQETPLHPIDIVTGPSKNRYKRTKTSDAK
jgi:hypothetical protein